MDLISDDVFMNELSSMVVQTQREAWDHEHLIQSNFDQISEAEFIVAPASQIEEQPADYSIFTVIIEVCQFNFIWLTLEDYVQQQSELQDVSIGTILPTLYTLIVFVYWVLPHFKTRGQLFSNLGGLMREPEHICQRAIVYADHRFIEILLRKMAKLARGSRKLSSRQFRSTPYPVHSYQQGLSEKEDHPEKLPKTMQKKDWEDATCSVCMEFPHNAVLLLCSSYDKGCRPYMCGTSYHFSNCLDLYKKAYTKVLSQQSQDHDSGASCWPLSEKSEVIELACPLCRGQVKGWTVVEPAREYLNAKKRSCMQDNCSFVGTYKELRKHVRAEHPAAKPREVDPALEQKWRRLEHEREQEDVMSVIRSSMPGAIVWGDYVIEAGHNGAGPDAEEGDADRDGNNGAIRGFDPNILRFYFLLRAYEDSSGSFAARLRRASRRSSALEREEGSRHHSFLAQNDTNDAVAAGASEGDDDEAPVIGTRQGRGLGRAERRRRRRRNNSSSRGQSPIRID